MKAGSADAALQTDALDKSFGNLWNLSRSDEVEQLVPTELPSQLQEAQDGSACMPGWSSTTSRTRMEEQIYLY